MICKPERRLSAQEVIEHKWVKMMTAEDAKQAKKDLA
jgi:hypothetical protein